MSVAFDSSVGDSRCVKEFGVDALIAFTGANMTGEAAFCGAIVVRMVVLQLAERPVVEPQCHVIFRAVGLFLALGYGVVDDLRDAWAGGVVYRDYCLGSQIANIIRQVHEIKIRFVSARCREVKGEVVSSCSQDVVVVPCFSRRVTYCFPAAVIPICRGVHARLCLGRTVRLGYMEGRRGASGGVVPRDGEGDALISFGDGVGVAGFRRGGDRIERAVGLDAEG